MIAGIDTGGTFTDCIVFEGERALVHKRLSTPQQPAEAVLDGLKQLQNGLSQPVQALVHGTTVATNALLERKGARVTLLITAGFKDLLLIGRQNRPQLYALHPQRPPALYSHVLEVKERITAQGEALLPLEPGEISRLLAAIPPDTEAIAICLLFAYAWPQHEQLLAAALRQAGWQVSASHEVLPVYREYERFSTTVANAALLPVMQRYMRHLEKGLQGVPCRLMQSNGGSLELDAVRRLPVRCALSGPAGGLIGALELGRLMQRQRLLTFDMGGTSTDVALIDQQLRQQSETLISGIPLALPMLDMHTVGAGGGSLVSVDAGGALQVGPQSAGAQPGPVCYGVGQQLTVTDAHVLLGRIPSQTQLGGSLSLQLAPVRAAFDQLAQELGLPAESLAEGILAVANAHMERALRVVSVERGLNPADFSLFCFGGAGGLHACALARSLGIPEILLPIHAGVFSAFGMLFAPDIQALSQTVLGQVELQAEAEITAVFQAMQQSLSQHPQQQVELWLDLRYFGQSFEIAVPWLGSSQQATAAFHQAHQQLHNYARPEQPLELVTLHLQQRVPVSPPQLPRWQVSEPAVPTWTEVWQAGQWRSLPLYQRQQLAVDQVLQGPALIVEANSTFWLEAGFEAHCDAWGNLRVSLLTAPPAA